MARLSLAICVFAVACQDICAGNVTRTTLTAAVASDSAPYGSATIQVLEFEDGAAPLSLIGSFPGPDSGASELRGHVTSAVLSNMRGDTLYEFAVGPIQNGGFLPTTMDEVSSHTAKAIVSAAMTGGAVLELHTELADAPLLRVQLHATERRAVQRGSCTSVSMP